jgi:hypothetical protein
MYPVLLSTLLFGFLFLAGPSQGSAEQGKPSAPGDKTPLEDVIPLTMANMRGHKMLYNEGWFIVTSSSRALAYAKEKSLVSSGAALRQLLHETTERSAEYREAIKSDARKSLDTGKDLVLSGTGQSREILAETHQLAKAEAAYSRQNFQKAMDAFVRGNMTIAARTAEERAELASLPGNYYRSLKDDFSNMFELTEEVRKRFSRKIDPAWESAFQKAAREFQAEYERSGEEPNSLMALGPILSGYLKSLYHGIAAPASKTIVKTTVAGTTYAVFLPLAGTTIVAGRTVQSVGLTVYYAGKTGIKVVSPTVEGGLLSGLSLLSLSSVPVTYTLGGTLGAVNQVAYSAVGPAAATVQAAATTGFHSAGYVGFVAYDAAKGTTRVVINQAASGVVLGYNALTAIPTHLLIAASDTAVFLAWDGPRLVIAAARGKVKFGKDDAAESFSLGDLPVGTVVDLQKLQSVDGVTVDILSTDPAVIRDVIEKTPDDLRVKNHDAQ